jgi:glycosyltransferase involved in cell wall biosynthesis
MRVLITTGIYALAGPSIVIENLADQLGKRGVEVTIGALKFKRIPPNGAYNVRTLPVYNALKLNRFLDDFDIVHNHHPIMNYLALVSRTPFVYHYHGAPDFGRGYLFRFSMLLSVRIMNHAFSAIIAVSETGSEELKRYFGLNNVYVIYNGVDIKRFRQRLEGRFRIGAPQFLFVGNLYEYKKVEELILALKELVKAFPKAHLQIVGDGHMYERLKRFVAELKLEDHVGLVGRVPDWELPYYYASCDVYVTASRWELFGLPLLEAMACGKPVVASSIPSHVELLTKSNAGEIYAVGDVEALCKKMIRTYEESEKYRDNAINFAKEHDWSVVADRVLKLYANLVRVL